MDAHELYKTGHLGDAITAMNEEVRSKPADFDSRGFLCELLCIAGKFERADAQLDVMTKLDGAAAPGIALIRQLIRAATTRTEVHSSGRVPEFLKEPSAGTAKRLKASVLARAGDNSAALELLTELEDQTSALTGTCDGAAFEGFRDMDDLLSGVFEVLTSTGKYYWVPFEDVESVALRTPERPLDLLWRPAEMTVRGGPDGVVYLPSVYANLGDEMDEAAALGRVTDWQGAEGEPVRGIGLRTYLVGESDMNILQLNALEFDQVGGPAA